MRFIEGMAVHEIRTDAEKNKQPFLGWKNPSNKTNPTEVVTLEAIGDCVRGMTRTEEWMLSGQVKGGMLQYLLSTHCVPALYQELCKCLL